METHDSLGRRDRYKRTPYRSISDNPLSATRGDIAMIEAIHHHGPLSSIYLPEFRRDVHASRQGAVRRLNVLFNETNTVDGGAYLSRPSQQRRTEYAHSKHLVYDLTPASERLLKRMGKWHEHSPPRNPWTHSFMVAAITASIELLCKANGYRFIPAHEILDRAGATLRQNVEFAWKKKHLGVDLIPDALFAIDYGGQFRAFVVEADRGSEPITTPKANRKSVMRNLLQYRSFVGDRLYQDAYGLTARMVVLNVFTRQSRMTHAIDHIEKESAKNSYMLFQHVEGFGEIFAPPPVLSLLFTQPWQRAGFDSFSIDRA